MIPTFDPRPVALEGDHVILEPLALHHAADLFTAGDDPEIWRYKSILRPADLGEAEAWIADAIERGGGGAEIPFAIIHRASGRAIGSTRYLDIRRSDRALEIGWTWIGREHQRSAVNTECKYLLLANAFARHWNRVEFKTDSRNARSRAALRKLGATEEGVLRHHMWMPQGYFRDSVYFSVLAGEWPRVRAALETRLAAFA